MCFLISKIQYSCNKRNFKQWWSTIQPISTKWMTTSHLKSLNNNYLSPELIEQQLPLTWNHWTTTTSHLKSLNNNYLSPEIIEQLPPTWNHWTTTTSHLKSLNNNYLSPEIIEQSPEIIEQQLPLTWNHWTQQDHNKTDRNPGPILGQSLTCSIYGQVLIISLATYMSQNHY
jgi:hypothetical protein